MSGRLTNDLVLQCPQITNPLGERELSLRGTGLQSLDSSSVGGGGSGAGENSSISSGGIGIASAGGMSKGKAGTSLLYTISQQFDMLDLCDNRIRHLDDFSVLAPASTLDLANSSSGSSNNSTAAVINSSGNLMGYEKTKKKNNNTSRRPKGISAKAFFGASLAPPVRLTTLVLHNNQLRSLSAAAARGLAPTLHTFVAHRNFFTEFSDVANFARLTNLERLSLKENPIVNKQGQKYRLYLISRCPKLKLLDFNRVLEKEREAAATFVLPEVETTAAAVSTNSDGAQPSGRGARRAARKKAREAAAAGNDSIDGNGDQNGGGLIVATSEIESASSAAAAPPQKKQRVEAEPEDAVAADNDADTVKPASEMTLAERREDIEVRLANADTVEEMEIIEKELEELEALEAAQ